MQLIMLPSLFQTFIGVLLLTDIILLSTERQNTCIRILALQGAILGLMPIALEEQFTWGALGISGIFFVIKAIILPYMLLRAHKSLPLSPPLRPYMGYGLCVLAGIAGFGFSLWLGKVLPEPANPNFMSCFTPAFTTILTGLLIIVTRRKALTQVMGYLVMENGIYLLGVPLSQDGHIWLELSILMDVFAGIVIMVLAIHQLNKVFDTTDVEQIVTLRD